jgi:hypothetical protein
MIPYEDLVAALTYWRERNGLPTGAADYLGEPPPPPPVSFEQYETPTGPASEQILDGDMFEEALVGQEAIAEDHTYDEPIAEESYDAAEYAEQPEYAEVESNSEFADLAAELSEPEPEYAEPGEPTPPEAEFEGDGADEYEVSEFEASVDDGVYAAAEEDITDVAGGLPDPGTDPAVVSEGTQQVWGGNLGDEEAEAPLADPPFDPENPEG